MFLEYMLTKLKKEKRKKASRNLQYKSSQNQPTMSTVKILVYLIQKKKKLDLRLRCFWQAVVSFRWNKEERKHEKFVVQKQSKSTNNEYSKNIGLSYPKKQTIQDHSSDNTLLLLFSLQKIQPPHSFCEASGRLSCPFGGIKKSKYIIFFSLFAA